MIAVLAGLVCLLLGWAAHALSPAMRSRRADAARLTGTARELGEYADALEARGDWLEAAGRKGEAVAVLKEAVRLRTIKSEAIRAAQAAEVRALSLLDPRGDERQDEG